MMKYDLSNRAVKPRLLGRGYKALMFCSIIIGHD